MAALAVSVLFNEPKLLKSANLVFTQTLLSFVSVLFNEPKLLKFALDSFTENRIAPVSVLFNEPKLLKSAVGLAALSAGISFSALQRAEIAEMFIVSAGRLW